MAWSDARCGVFPPLTHTLISSSDGRSRHLRSHPDTTDAVLAPPLFRSQANQKRYHELDATQTVGELLKGKVVIEFPTIHVALPAEVARYPSSQEGPPASAGEGAKAAA